MEQMLNVEQSMAMLAVGLAGPLVAVAVGCGDNKKKNRGNKNQKAGSKHSKHTAREPKSKSQSRSKSKRASDSVKSSAAARKAADQSVSLKTAKIATSSQLAAKPGALKPGAGSKSEMKRSASRTSTSVSAKRSASKRRSGAKRFASKRSKQSSQASKRSSSIKSRSTKRRSKKSKNKLLTASASSKKAPGGAGAVHDDKSAARSKSIKKTSISQSMADRNYIPVGAPKVKELNVCPDSLTFSNQGGQNQLTVTNSDSGKRFAVKAKCSDNQLYRVNPVFSFVEPGQTVVFTVYRHCAAPKIDKLVFVTAEVSKEDANPTAAFKDKNAVHPMMLVPLHARSTNMAHMDGLQRAQCACLAKA